jgi:hypothetical protein
LQVKWQDLLGTQKAATTILVLFITSIDRFEDPLDQDFWVTEGLSMLGRYFGGATAFPQGRGVWRDDERGGQLIFDAPVVVQCYTNETDLETYAEDLREFLTRMGQEARQGAVRLVIDRDCLEIRFSLAEE